MWPMGIKPTNLTLAYDPLYHSIYHLLYIYIAALLPTY
jgi:hypothetical protein